jgi:hypothetical protein
VLVVLTAIGAAAGEDDDGKVDTAGGTSTTADQEDTSTTAGTKSLRRAADDAADGLGFGVSSASMEHVILSMCDGSVAASSDAIEGITREPEQEYQTLQAGLAAARQSCPDRVSSFPYLGSDVLAELGARKDAATSTTAAPVTTAAPAPVVKAPVTTKAPATTQAPVVTQPQPVAGNCDPNYSGCLDPSSSDYDCAGGSGNGPDYTGTVQVLGNDHYDLDRDHDGVGCEDS